MRFSPKEMVLVALFAGLTTIGAFLKIPIGPTPVSLQSFFTIASGLFLGSRLGALSQVLYIAMGLMGLPVFTSGGGPSYVLNPTFGFLIGFVVCAYTAGVISEKLGVSKKSYALASLVGTCSLYIIGVPWLYLVLTRISGVSMSFMGAMKAGCIVFLPGDLLKIIFVSYLAYKIVPRLKFDFKV